MFKCDRCGAGFTNSEAKGLESCPRCHEDGVTAPLAFSLFAANGPSSGAVDRCRRTFRELDSLPDDPLSRARTALPSELPAPTGRSTDISEGEGAPP